MLKQKLINLMNNTELTWSDRVIEKMKELEDTFRQTSEMSINSQVLANMKQIREKNKKIVELTQVKEEILSKMLQAVSDKDLKDLQTQHSDLIGQY